MPTRPHPPDALTTEMTAPTYDWARFGRHRLRAPNGAIIDLPVHIEATATVWVATTWPDPHQPGGWARHVWALDPTTGRGWQLPHQLAAGDVLEFGADTPYAPVRWYAIMDSYEIDRWATVQGPYPHPSHAHAEAQRLLALERYVEPLHAEPPHQGHNFAAPLPRRHGQHRRRRHQHPGRSNPT